jgi:hypothetical protein
MIPLSGGVDQQAFGGHGVPTSDSGWPVRPGPGHQYNSESYKLPNNPFRGGMPVTPRHFDEPHVWNGRRIRIRRLCSRCRATNRPPDFGRGSAIAAGASAPGKGSARSLSVFRRRRNDRTIVGESFARERFGDQWGLSKGLELDGRSYEVIGVIRESLALPPGIRIWVPLALNSEPMQGGPVQLICTAGLFLSRG